MSTSYFKSFLVLAGLLGMNPCAQGGESVTSPDGKWVVFVKPVAGPLISWGAGEESPTELWQTDSQGRNPTRLVRCRNSDDTTKIIAGFVNLHFSSNGRLVYFETPAWATEDAVHVVDTTNSKEHYVCEGTLRGLRASASGDFLYIWKRKHYGPPNYGAYFQLFLVSPDGNEIRAIGDKVNS